MAYEIVYVDGEKFTPEMAYWFLRLKEWFYQTTGYEIKASSGLRLAWEQEAIFRERYVPASQVNGRYVYDWRWWNGVQWGRISSAGTVATPGTSNHEFEATGIGAVDVYDTGPDAGVSVGGSYRSNLLVENLWRFNFDNEGFNFGEAWHKRFTGNLFASRPNWAGGDAVPFPTPAPTPSAQLLWQKEDEGMSDQKFLAHLNDEAGIRNPDKKGQPYKVWALTDGVPGSKIWWEHTDQITANAFAARFGSQIPLTYDGWDEMKAKVLGTVVPGK